MLGVVVCMFACVCVLGGVGVYVYVCKWWVCLCVCVGWVVGCDCVCA